MKKIFYLSCLLICTLSLCGCESSEKDREGIFKALKDKEIISDTMKQIDSQYSSFYGMWCEGKTYYIYQDEDDNMIAIEYNYGTQNEDTEHLVTIYRNITLNDEEINTIDEEDAKCEDGFYKYQNGEYTDNNKYNFDYDTREQYEVSVKYYIIYTKYNIVEHESN